jgi:two-component system sensor histidine kinase KdpD
VTIGSGLALASVVVWFLQGTVGVPNASAVYLVAVVTAAIAGGTLGAVVSAVASFLLYNFLFTQPLYTFTIADPGVLLNVVLLLFVGIVVGQLAALQRTRAEVAQAREREARSLFSLSRTLATRESTTRVLPEVARILATEAAMERIWISVGADDAAERVVADTGGEAPRRVPAVVSVLRRTPGEAPATWTRVHAAAGARNPEGLVAYRVRIEAGGRTVGSIWSLRGRDAEAPDSAQTRLLAAVADQLGQALTLDRLAAESAAAEVARQGDMLKSALLQSVSHDLRTPLATIRAAAGTLKRTASEDDERESAEAIEREVDYLNALVSNLLDLGRIEAGALRTEDEIVDVDDAIEAAVSRLRRRLGGRQVHVAIAAGAVRADPVLLDQALTNLLDNAVRYTAPDRRIVVSATGVDGATVRITVEDDGEGVPTEALPRLFEKFYRVPGRGRSSGRGTGIGLAVVAGFVEAMGGRVGARPSELGGLAVDLELPAATVPQVEVGR